MARFAALLVMVSLLSAAESGEKETPQAVMASPFGTVIQRGKTLDIPAYKKPVPLGELTTLPGLRGLIDLKKGKVRLNLIGHVPEMSPSPSLESVVELHAAKDADLDFTLVRGQALVELQQDAAKAKVKARLPGKTVLLELQDKTARVAFQHVSYWPEGASFKAKPPKGYAPEQETVVIVAAGKVEIDIDGEKQVVHGPALSFWRGEQFLRPTALKEVPLWAQANAKPSAEVQALQKAGDLLRRLMEKGQEKAFAEAQSAKDANLRALAAYGAAALDDMSRCVEFLGQDKDAGVRRAAAAALRGYIGRNAAKDTELFTHLREQAKTGPATIVLELLHGFPEAARSRPETFDALINYLQSDVQAVRHLAAEQLVRLVPKGKNITYDAAAPKEQRATGQTAWRKLVAEQFPPQ